MGCGGQRDQGHGAGAAADGLRRRQQRHRDDRQSAFRQRYGHGCAGHADERHWSARLLRGGLFRSGGSSTASVDVGTNGGTAWTRPNTPPASSATALVTTYAYNAVGLVQDVTDPMGIVTAHAVRRPGPDDQDDSGLYRRRARRRERHHDGVRLRWQRQCDLCAGRRAGRCLSEDGLRLRRDHGFAAAASTATTCCRRCSIPTRPRAIPAAASKTAISSMRWARRRRRPTATATCINTATTCWAA